MKAVVVEKPGGPEELKIREVPIPTPGEGELLVRVKAGAINRTDILARKGGGSAYKKATNRLGVEMAGVVEEVGKQAGAWQAGDKVMGLVSGSYAEYVVIPADRAMRIPDNLSYIEAAAIPEVFLTAYQTLYWIGKLQEGETVLIHAGASGVGTAAIQLAKQVSKANVIVTAGSAEKLAYCKELGADHVIDYKRAAFEQEVERITDGKGANLILDFIGAAYWKKNIQSASMDGRLVLIGTLGGKETDVDLSELMGKRLQVTGTLLTPRSDAYKAELSQELAQKILPLFESGVIKPIIDTVFPLEEIQLAHRRMEANENIGKIIFRVGEQA
ncbi:NAD(P)H-quinone oxidoreductase [Brevibacillus centrosporus]|uniref:NAD(P)H-quinone oxidoreductase n=1 Tax=Brevibacillus centrosporus TaxID=54910 RepID=UPI000F0A18AA|nr:NAD(P)H-quinone oxidoreductase [Brevibacillus centrosporus]MEC2133220.1 NAD(P)H-quinone oxidoreductase [Brevibacillus centrosporus]RNB64961.1 NAD(P)H-quinone oxidoreductase [Brevibacillus centrosporus]GED31173.1 alcohol dehydrogenase [Brevibacillus centrosporus]